MKKLFALFTFTALVACSSNSNPLTSALDEEEISSSSFAEEEQSSSSRMSSSSSEDISSSSTEEIQSSTSKASHVCEVDKFMYDVVHMSERSKPYIVLYRNQTHTEFDKADCELFTTFVTPQNDTLHHQSYVDIRTTVAIGVPVDLTKSTINLVHVVRKCEFKSERTVTEYDPDCVLTLEF